MVGATMTKTDAEKTVEMVLVPVVFLLHILLIVAITIVARAEHMQDGTLALPTRFRSVLYLDVFGWLGGPDSVAASDPVGLVTPQQQQAQQSEKLSPQAKKDLLKYVV